MLNSAQERKREWKGNITKQKNMQNIYTDIIQRENKLLIQNLKEISTEFMFACKRPWKQKEKQNYNNNK